MSALEELYNVKESGSSQLHGGGEILTDLQEVRKI